MEQKQAKHVQIVVKLDRIQKHQDAVNHRWMAAHLSEVTDSLFIIRSVFILEAGDRFMLFIYAVWSHLSPSINNYITINSCLFSLMVSFVVSSHL